MFGGSDSGCLMAYSWQSGMFLSTFLKTGNRGVLRAFPGGGLGKRGLIRGWIGCTKDTVRWVKNEEFRGLNRQWIYGTCYAPSRQQQGRNKKNMFLELFCFEARDSSDKFWPVTGNSFPDKLLHPRKDRYRHHLLPDQGHVLTVIIPD